MTGHNIIIMTIIAHFSSFLEAGAVDDNANEWKYWASRFRKSSCKDVGYNRSYAMNYVLSMIFYDIPLVII